MLYFKCVLVLYHTTVSSGVKGRLNKLYSVFIIVLPILNKFGEIDSVYPGSSI
jgi:hypothetical protein